MKLRGIERIMGATTLAVAAVTAGIAGQAQAFSFNQGDLVLAIYGNSTEALYNLGPASTRLASGQSFNLDVSAGLQAAGVGTNPVKYTVFGHDIADEGATLSVWAGSKVDPGQIDPSKLGLQLQFGFSANAQAFSVFDGNTIPKADSLKSFSGNFNNAGAGNFDGTWPVAAQGDLGDILNVLKGDVNTNTFSQVGRILLGADGLLTIGNPGPSTAPVPLPAGVVLFGSGLIGLIGIARRSFTQQAA